MKDRAIGKLVGVDRFELSASCAQDRRADLAALHPESVHPVDRFDSAYGLLPFRETRPKGFVLCTVEYDHVLLAGIAPSEFYNSQERAPFFQVLNWRAIFPVSHRESKLCAFSRDAVLADWN